MDRKFRDSRSSFLPTQSRNTWRAAGAANTEGPTDTVFREGLDYYWKDQYSSAIPKFEEVKRLFPQHSEVDRLVQSSQQAKAEGREKSSFPLWLVAAIVGVILLIGVILIIVAIVVIMMRREESETCRAAPAAGGKAHPAPSPAAYSPPPPAPKPSPAHALRPRRHRRHQHLLRMFSQAIRA